MKNDRWEKLKDYCLMKLGQAMELCPKIDSPRDSQLWVECCYAAKYYYDVVLRMEEFESKE